MKLKRQNIDNSKIKMISELQNLVKQYYVLVDELSSIFTNETKKDELIEEIKILETTLKSKLSITSCMKGF